jgi:hypothetical protein
MSLSNADFLSNFRYHILADNEPGACFQECNDLIAGQSQAVRHIVLSRGAFVTPAFFDWVMQHSATRTLTIVLHNEKQAPVAVWELGGARVAKVTATTFTGKGFPFRVEELELSVQWITAGEKL